MIKLAIGLLVLFVFSCSKSASIPTDIGNQQDNSDYAYLELADQGYGPTDQHYLIHKDFGEFSMIILVHKDSIDIDTCKVYRKY